MMGRLSFPGRILLIIAGWLIAGHGFACNEETATVIKGEDSDVQLHYQFISSPAVGTPLVLDVSICNTVGKTLDASLGFDAVMPAHGHGMNYYPEIAKKGTGQYEISGVVLHMSGSWQLRFDLGMGDKQYRLSADQMLE